MQSRLILVTGARGFVGRRLCRYLADAGYRVRGTVRANPPAPEAGIEYRASGDIGGNVDWRPLLEGVDAVVHAAARVHFQGPGSLAVYRRANVTASVNLARQAAETGVRRLVFLSSIKAAEVERSGPGAASHEPYETTKLEAELALSGIADETGLEIVILRPPLVYGPDAAANFRLLVRAVAKGIPLPFGCIRNRRSFIYVGNLCSAIAACLEHPKAPGNVFEVSDGPPVSTPDFVRAIGQALGKPARLLPCPPGLLRAVGQALGRGPAADSLTCDLVADDKVFREHLGWHAPISMADAMKTTLTARRQEAP